MEKGQISIEFMIFIGIILLIFAFLIGLSASNRSVLIRNNQFIDLRSECLKLSNNIFGAYIGGDGMEIEDRINYGIQLVPSSNLIIVTDGEDEVTCTLPFNSFSSVNLIEGDIELKNDGGSVDVSNV